MKKLCMIMVVVLMMLVALGCSGFSEKVKLGVVLLDNTAASNEAIVEKLCTDPAAVTDDEKAEAVRNARIIHLGTSELRRVVVGNP